LDVGLGIGRWSCVFVGGMLCSTLARFAAESPKNSEIFARRTTSLQECRFSVFCIFSSFQGLFAVFFLEYADCYHIDFQ
jgi:hypothetical protein